MHGYLVGHPRPYSIADLAQVAEDLGLDAEVLARDLQEHTHAGGSRNISSVEFATGSAICRPSSSTANCMRVPQARMALNISCRKCFALSPESSRATADQ